MKSIYLILLLATIIIITGCAKENIPGVNTISNKNVRAVIKRVVDKTLTVSKIKIFRCKIFIQYSHYIS